MIRIFPKMKDYFNKIFIISLLSHCTALWRKHTALPFSQWRLCIQIVLFTFSMMKETRRCALTISCVKNSISLQSKSFTENSKPNSILTPEITSRRTHPLSEWFSTDLSLFLSFNYFGSFGENWFLFVCDGLSLIRTCELKERRFMKYED